MVPNCILLQGLFPPKIMVPSQAHGDFFNVHFHCGIPWVHHCMTIWQIIYLCPFLEFRLFSSLFSDADPGQQDPVLWWQQTNTHGLQKSCGEKGTAWPLSKWERARGLERVHESAHPCLDRLLLLFWAYYIRMVLIYYAQVHCRWLPFTVNKGQNTANSFKEKDVTAQGGKWLDWLHSILGRFSTDFRKLK